MAQFMIGSETFDAGSVDDGNEVTKEITVTGAVLGDFVLVSYSIDVTDLEYSGQVTTADTVTTVLSNNTGSAIDLASATVRALVISFDIFE